VVPDPKLTAPVEGDAPSYSMTSRKALTMVEPAGGAQAMVTKLPLSTEVELPAQKSTETPEAP
jgi:hypothetical protein